jgi:hypothetical protein
LVQLSISTIIGGIGGISPIRIPLLFIIIMPLYSYASTLQEWPYEKCI